MLKTTFACVLAGLLALPAVAAESPNVSGNRSPLDLTMGQIADTEWNLRHSSVAKAISKDVQDSYLALLAKARQEAAEGNLRTAQELTRRAARPLSQMDEDALAGKHPDNGTHLVELKQTLRSIIDSLEKIAREKGASTDFAAQARAVVVQAEMLARNGQGEAARELVLDTYATVQSAVAGLRDGDWLVVGLRPDRGEKAWSDGLRRLDERRHLTRYLIIEADVEGIDSTPLHAGMAAAEDLLVKAARQAQAQRWDLAVNSLEMAYLKHEDAWRKVGVDW